jgi:hypothetical protein
MGGTRGSEFNPRPVVDTEMHVSQDFVCQSILLLCCSLYIS